MLEVCEIFYSVQGEGLYAGMPSVFVRFSGCNLACTWCDTPYASRPGPADAPRPMTADGILAAVAPHPAAAHVVLTGGEPMLQADLPELADALAAAGRTVTLETNATVPPGLVRCALASLSPKLPGSQPDGAAGALDAGVVAAWLARGPCQLKFVIATAADLDAVDAFLRALPAPPPPERVFLMPEGRAPAAVRILGPAPCRFTRQEQEVGGKGALFPPTSFIRDARSRGTGAKMRTAGAPAVAVAGGGGDLVQACLRRGMRYGHRLQLDLFGNRRGT